MRRIELKHFSPASCWSEFSLCGCSWGKSWVPHISGIFQLCLGCCSCSACWLWAPAMLCAQAELASWPKYLCFGRVWQARERAGSLWQSHHCFSLRIKRWILCLSPGRKELWEHPEVQPHGRGSPRVLGAALMQPLPFGRSVPRREGWHSCWVILGLLWQLCRILHPADVWELGICLHPWSCSASALSSCILEEQIPWGQCHAHAQSALSPLTPVQWDFLITSVVHPGAFFPVGGILEAVLMLELFGCRPALGEQNPLPFHSFICWMETRESTSRIQEQEKWHQQQGIIFFLLSQAFLCLQF